MRQIVLDTETTGLEPKLGHRIIEIGAVELINRKLTGHHYHQYIQPEREIDEGALAVHGITQEFLADKPKFNDIAEDFMQYIDGAELIIHNAPFDVGFINYELTLLNKKWKTLNHYCKIIDTLVMAREMHPGQKNNLDALCKRYSVNNSHRELHGALLDAEILADVYLMMTGGQVSLTLDNNSGTGTSNNKTSFTPIPPDRDNIVVVQATSEELNEHEANLQRIQKASQDSCVWLNLENPKN